MVATKLRRGIVMYDNNAMAYTILVLGGLGYLIYKTWDFYNQRNQLQKKLDETSRLIKESQKELQSTADDIDDTIEAIFARTIDMAKTLTNTYKVAAKTLTPTDSKKLARKIARDIVSSTSNNKLAESLQDSNTKKLGYYGLLFPDIQIGGLDADLDKEEIMNSIAEYLYNKKK